MKYEMPYRNVFETLQASAARFPDKTAIIDDAGCISYRDLVERVEAVAAHLYHNLGCRSGDRIALLMANSIDAVAAFYAVVKIGCISVTINTKLRAPQISSEVTNGGCRVMLLDQEWKDKVVPYTQETGLEHLVFDTTVEEGEVSIAGLVAAGAWKAQPAETVLEDELPAVIMYTSGSSGVPKGALILHENILQTAYGYVEVEQLNSDDLTVLCVPFFHILGMSCVTTMFMYLGGTLVLERFFNAEKTLSDITRYRATHFHSAPTVYIKLLEAYRKEAHDLSTVRICVCGGAVIAEKDIEAFCQIAPNARFTIAYGMTETAGGGMLARKHKGYPAPMPNLDLRLVDEHFQDVPVGQRGEILMKGPMVITRYFRDLHKDSFHEGWIRTGDIGVRQEDGSVQICGRMKEVINRGGEKVSPTMVELVITSHPHVQQAIVVAVPDSVYGEVGAAMIVPKNGYTLNAQEIKDFLVKRISTPEIPAVMVFQNDLPYTASEKVDRKAIAQQLAEVKKVYGL